MDAPQKPSERNLLNTPLKWVGAVTAIVSLILGLNQVTRLFSELGERQRQVAELKEVSEQQQRAGDFPGAWASLTQAVAIADQGGYLAKVTGRLSAERTGLRESQEDVAMAWLEQASAPAGKKFSDVVDPLLPVVARGIATATGQRKADLLAHAGWAYFLKSRDGAEGTEPHALYQQAIEADASNPYAHANWGHWIVWTRGPLEEATAHFASALASGRHRPYVRRMQLAAMRLNSAPATSAEYLRAVSDMVKNQEPVDPAVRRDLYGLYFFAFGDDALFDRLVAAVPPTEQIAAIRALFFDVDFDPSRAPLRDACLARLQEAAGEPAEALKTWRALLTSLPPSAAGRVVDRARAAVTRLSAAT